MKKNIMEHYSNNIVFYVNRRKIFYVGNASAQVILDKFNEGYNVLDIVEYVQDRVRKHISSPVSSNIE